MMSVYWRPVGSRTWGFQRTHYLTLKSMMAAIRRLENRRDVIFFISLSRGHISALWQVGNQLKTCHQVSQNKLFDLLTLRVYRFIPLPRYSPV